MLRFLRLAGLTVASIGAYGQGVLDNPAFVTNSPAGGVSVINTSTNTFVAPILGFSDPKGITVTADGTRVYVADYGASSIVAINALTLQRVMDIPVPTKPNAVAVSPDGLRLYVASEIGVVYVVDSVSKAVLNTITPLGTHVFEHIIINKAGTRVYVASQMGTGNVVIINTANNGIL